jgi:tetratricopeptide (TPR) repeat protein
MAERQPTPRAQRPNRKSADGAPSRPATSRTFRLLLFATLAVLTALLIYVYTRPSGPRSLVAEAVADAEPEVAEQLSELDDVVSRLVETFPDEPAAFDVMGWLHYKIGKVEQAEVFWKYCLQLDPDFAPAHHALGLKGLELGEYETAATHFRRTVQLEPTNSAFKVELAQALVEIGESEEAIDVLLDDLRDNPKAVATVAMLGHAYLQTRDYARAKQHFQTAIEYGPNYTNAYKGMVDACRGLGEMDLAREYADKLQEKKRQDTAQHRQRLKTYDDKANIASTMAEVYTAVANVYLAAGDPEAAEQHFQKAIKHSEGFTPAYELLAWIYKMQGRTKLSADTLRELLRRSPNSLSAHLTAGSMFTEMEYLDEAEEAYRGAIRLTPRMAGGYIALARFLLRSHRHLPEARELAKTAVGIEPLASNYYLLATACQANKDVEGALEAINHAAKLEPLNPQYARLRQYLSSQL